MSWHGSVVLFANDNGSRGAVYEESASSLGLDTLFVNEVISNGTQHDETAVMSILKRCFDVWRWYSVR